jgi:hypothetical protein
MAPVTLHVWRVPRRNVPAALARVAYDRARLRRTPEIRFAKLLGTGNGRSFRPGDTDLTRWAAVVAWDDEAASAGFAETAVARGWRAISAGHATVDLRPVSSHGTWSGRMPFDRSGPARPRTDGPVLALTRARLRPGRAWTFWRAVPPVARELHRAPGLVARFGIGEAPVGWQGTVSVWRSAADLVGFAYRLPEHRAAIARTATAGWYAEELFARFDVCGVSGDRSVLGWDDAALDGRGS